MSEPAGLCFARQVVRLGWKVIPAFVNASGEKIPLCGGRWPEKATLDERVLEEWWERRPWAWPGTVSGVGSSLVMDVDGPVAVEWFRDLVEKAGGWVSGGLLYRTPGKGGGLHVVWDYPSWLVREFSQAKVILEGGEVQLRGNGHYTLLCGARRPDLPVGERDYTLLEEPQVGVSREPPRRLVDLFLEQAVSGRVGESYAGGLVALTVEEAWGLGLLQDGRKNACAGLAWGLAIRGEPEEAVREIVMRFNEECCTPSLSNAVVEKKVSYAVQRAEAFRVKEEKVARQVMNDLGWGGLGRL